MIHLNLQIALGMTQIVFLAGGSATHNEVGNSLLRIGLPALIAYIQCLLIPINLTDYSFFTQWPRFRVKHLQEFVRSRTELQPCY